MEGKWYEVIRYDTAHGYLHVQKFWQSPKPIKLPEFEHTGMKEIFDIDRDLKLLRGYGLVEMKREGQKVRPIIYKEGIFLPLVKPKPISALAE